MSEREDDREDRRLRDLAAEARRHVLHAERLRVDLLREQPFVQPSSCSRRLQLLEPDLEALVAVAPGRRCPRPWTTASARPIACAWARTVSSDVGFGVLNVICTPPLKSMPRFRPRTPSDRTPIATPTPRDDEPERDALHEVDLQERAALAVVRAHEARVLEPAEAGEQAEHRARRRDGGDQRDDRADQQHEREALHARRRDREQDQRGDRGDDVRVDDRAEALRVPGGDRGAHRLAGARLFLDAFEDDHVRVGGDADRQDQAGEARQRQRRRRRAGSPRT